MEVLDKVRAAAKIPDLTDAEASTLAHASSGGPTGFANALFKITDDRRMMAAKSIKDQEDAKIRAKYHEFFDADGRILLTDIGHYESEQFTIDLLADRLEQKFPNFAVLKTGVNTNPVQYF